MEVFPSGSSEGKGRSAIEAAAVLSYQIQLPRLLKARKDDIDVVQI